MGKIVDALKVAHGEVAELVLRSLEEPGMAAPDTSAPAETTQLKEPPSGRPLPLPRIVPREPQPLRMEAAPAVATMEAPAAAPPAHAPRLEPAVGRWQIQALPISVSDEAPLLSALPFEQHALEQYRFVRTRIVHYSGAPATIVVTSPGIGDGKSVTAINLAGAFAQTGDEEVLLVDGDLRCSTVHSYLHVPQSPGLSEVLAGRCSLAEAVFRVQQMPGLCILPAGGPGGNPTELLGSSRWPALVKTLRQHFHKIIVDCPPAEAVADYDLIAEGCDGVLLVVRPDRTNRTLCLRALEKTRKKLLGVLMNCTAERALMKQYMSHYYSYSRQQEKKG